MKRFTHLLILVFLSQLSTAQETSKNTAHEIGLNVNALLNQFIFKSSDENLGEEILTIAPIYSQLLTYRYYLNERSALRGVLGIGNRNKRDTSLLFFSSSVNARKTNQVNLNFGYQRMVKLGKRVQFYFGAEIRYEYEKNSDSFYQYFSSDPQFFSTEEATRTTTNYGNQIGFSLPIGFQFYLTDRISISTEGNLEVYSLFKNEIIVNNDKSENSTKNNFTGFSSNIPNILFLNFKF